MKTAPTTASSASRLCGTAVDVVGAEDLSFPYGNSFGRVSVIYSLVFWVCPMTHHHLSCHHPRACQNRAFSGNPQTWKDAHCSPLKGEPARSFPPAQRSHLRAY